MLFYYNNTLLLLELHMEKELELVDRRSKPREAITAKKPTVNEDELIFIFEEEFEENPAKKLNLEQVALVNAFKLTLEVLCKKNGSISNEEFVEIFEKMGMTDIHKSGIYCASYLKALQDAAKIGYRDQYLSIIRQKDSNERFDRLIEKINKMSDRFNNSLEDLDKKLDEVMEKIALITNSSTLNK